MDSSNQPDRLSSLADVLLIIIISSLPFEECVRTSVLSKRWRNLCHETKNISFKESEYVGHSVSDNASKRVSFVAYMLQWVSRFGSEVIESFELCFSIPVGFVAEIESLIEFAVSRKVKKLVLDFSDPAWRGTGHASWFNVAVQLPLCVYGLTTLKSLKISACGFDPLKFSDSGFPRRFSVGWISLTNVEALVLNPPMLESLSINNCWDLDIFKIGGDMKEFVFENCDFPFMACSFDLPNVDIFKYSGNVLPLHFEKMNEVINEVYLDFGIEHEYDVPSQSTQVDGDVLSGYLNSLRAARTLTVCPYLLQAIQECENPYYLLRPVETQHLVLRTKLQPKEFKGIKLLLDNCPDLDTLTLDILPPNPYPTALTYGGINPQTYWFENITYESLPKKLKVVVVRNFGGGTNELNVLKFLIRYGRELWLRGLGHMLEKIDIHVPNVMEESEMMLARDGIEMLQGIANPVQVIVHNA